MRLNALEEHFIHSQVAATYGAADLALLARCMPALDELGDMRLQGMDEAGIDMQVLSHTKPGVHEIPDAQQAASLAVAANDYIALDSSSPTCKLSAGLTRCHLQTVILRKLANLNAERILKL